MKRARGLWLVLVAALAACPPALGQQALHPYQIMPALPTPGRTGCDAPTVSELRIEYDLAMQTGDTQKANECLGPIASESFLWGQPEFLSYSGSVEHVRSALQRYIPPYPIYNKYSLVKNFILSDYRPTRDSCTDFAENVYWHTQFGLRIPAQRRAEAVRCYPWQPGASITMELGKLKPRMMYAVRVIGALQTADLSDPRVINGPQLPSCEKQFVFQLQVNDRPDGTSSTYILRGRATDNFYEVACLMFPCLDKREYTATLTLLSESEATLYTYNIDVHNVFAQCAQRTGKIARTLTGPAAGGPVGESTEDPDARAARDEALWQSLPPINIELDGSAGSRAAAGWQGPDPAAEWDQPFRLFRRNERSGALELYLREDLESHKELPDSGDRGFGVRLAQPAGERHYASFIGQQAFIRYRTAGTKLHELIGRYKSAGDPIAARDAAFLLAALAYQYPAIQANNVMAYAESGTPEQPMRRYGPGTEPPGGWGPFEPWRLIVMVDELFDYTRFNQELATALGRFIPWVKTPADVQYLYEVYLVQYMAKEVMHFRYYYDHGLASMLIQAATIQNDNDITKEWMDFLFSRCWEYPQTLAGLDENIITNTGRDGTTTTGSWYYAQNAAPGLAAAMDTRQYAAAGGLPAYNLSDPARYPKSFRWLDFLLDSRVAGGQGLAVGDASPAAPAAASSPAAGASSPADQLAQQADLGWRLTGDPRFAWLLVHYADDSRLSRRARFSDPDWTAIEAAAAGRRSPLLETRSRVLGDWSAILEAGTQHDDVRFRRAVALRVGNGRGHAHDDTLDLRLWAHGCTMVGDIGAPGGHPASANSYVHNLVEVDGDGAPDAENTGNWDGYSWVRNLFDAPGAAYVRAESMAPLNHPDVSLYRRQVALIDADEQATPAPAALQARADVNTPASYVLDVFRVSGGKQHTYCFHGSIDDSELSPGGFEINAAERQVVGDESSSGAAKYLRGFDWQSLRAKTTGQPIADGDARWIARSDGDVLQATWRLGKGAEERMLRQNGAAVTPIRKYTRLHLFDATGLGVMHGIAADVEDAGRINPDVPQYAARCLFAQRSGGEAPLDSVFVAVIEPYAGEPFIKGRRLLTIENNEDDAFRAAAVEVQTANGRTDLCFSDGRPDDTRTLPGNVEVAGEFAYLSRDAQGLRQATLTGGTLLKSDQLELRVSRRQYHGQVAKVDYAARNVHVTGVPALADLAGSVFYMGSDQHPACFEVDRVSASLAGTQLHVKTGLELMRARIDEVDRQAGRVRTNIAMARYPGRSVGLTASGPDTARTWRARFDGGNRHEGFWFALTGKSIGRGDLPVGSKLSIWEVGEGDAITLRTGVSLRRTDPGDAWEVFANTSFTVAFPGAAQLEWSADGSTWSALKPDAAIGPGAGQPKRFFIRAGKAE